MSQNQNLAVFANNISAANSTGLYYSGSVNATSYTVGTSTIANSSGVYTGVVNGSTISVGSSITANSSKLVIGTAVAVQANGGVGTSGQALTSNGAGVYWSTIVGTNTDAQYVWTNTHTFNANLTLATTAGLKANGGVGTSGQVLTSNGSSVYWSTVSSSPLRQAFTGDGTTTSFAVSGGYTPGNIDVYGNGVKYASSEVTTSSGTNVVFGTAPPNGVVIDVVGYYLSNLSTGNASAIRQTFTGDGSTTSFTVSGGYNPNNLDVYGNGVKYASSEVTTSSGSVIVFGTAPPNGVVIDVIGYYLNNLTTVNTAQSYTWTGPHTFNANVTMSANLTIGTSAGLKANGSVGTTGQVLTSNGTSVYWATATTDPTPTVFLLMGA